MSRFTFKHSAIGAALVAASASFAADTETTPVRNAQVDDFKAGKTAVDAKAWQQAVDSFTKVVAKDPQNADAYNYPGFSLRWLDRYDQAFAAYDKALTLDPNHKGALNYSGIAYWKSGQKDKAQAQLKRLQTICATCEETAGLAKAFADAKQAQP